MNSHSSTRVTLILDPAFEASLEAHRSTHVWLVDTPTTRVVFADHRVKMRQADEGSFSTFQPHGVSPAEWLDAVMELIDSHHGPHAQDGPYAILHVIGIQPDERIVAMMADFGFRFIQPVADGFVAHQKDWGPEV